MEHQATSVYVNWRESPAACSTPQQCIINSGISLDRLLISHKYRVAITQSCVLANINIPGTSHDAEARQKSVDAVQYRCTIWAGGTGRTS